MAEVNNVVEQTVDMAEGTKEMVEAAVNSNGISMKHVGIAFGILVVSIAAVEKGPEVVGMIKKKIKKAPAEKK